MGIYINPKQNKLEWLQDNAIHAITRFPRGNHTDGENVQVVWIDNGGFEALGIATSSSELSAFSAPEDPRPKLFAMVPVERITEDLTGIADIRKAIVLA